MVAHNTAPAGLSFMIDDGGLMSRIGVAPNIVAYFAAKALGKSFAKARKTIIAQAPGGLKRLAKKAIYYTGFPRGGEEHLLLKFKDPSVFQRINQRLFSSSRVAGIHEFGGTILPKKGGALLIPQKGARGATGRRMADRLVGPTRDTFILKTRTGKALLFRRQGNAQPELIGLLARKVTIKPRLGVFRVWLSLAAYRAEAIREAVTQVTNALEGNRTVDQVANALLASAYRRQTRRSELGAPQVVSF